MKLKMFIFKFLKNSVFLVLLVNVFKKCVQVAVVVFVYKKVHPNEWGVALASQLYTKKFV